MIWNISNYSLRFTLFEFTNGSQNFVSHLFSILSTTFISKLRENWSNFLIGGTNRKNKRCKLSIESDGKMNLNIIRKNHHLFSFARAIALHHQQFYRNVNRNISIESIVLSSLDYKWSVEQADRTKHCTDYLCDFLWTAVWCLNWIGTRVFNWSRKVPETKWQWKWHLFKYSYIHADIYLMK